MYLPRSLAGRRDQTPSYARRAARTARSTSCASASAMSASFFSFAGFLVSKYLPAVGGVTSPLMNRSCRGAICTFAVSGAGAYCQSVEKFSFTPLDSAATGLAIVNTLLIRAALMRHARGEALYHGRRWFHDNG